MVYTMIWTHEGLENANHFLVQGNVTDGQYINVPFLTAMNQPITDLLKTSFPEDLELLKHEVSSECQGDSGNWLGKAFFSLKPQVQGSKKLSTNCFWSIYLTEKSPIYSEKRFPSYDFFILLGGRISCYNYRKLCW